MKVIRQNKIMVLAFGRIAEITGSLNELTAADLHDTEALKNHMHQLYPELKSVKFSISVNRKLIQENTVLPAEAEVALLPPFSGG